jgi:hypothetical protein
MANQYFNIHNGLQVGSLSIDAANGNITTSGTIISTGTNPASFAGAVNAGTLTSGTGQFNGTLTAVSVSAGTIGNIGAAIVGSSVNSGTGQFNGTLTAVSVSAGTIGNSGAAFSGATVTVTGVVSAGGNIYAGSGTSTSSTTTGALVVNGGAGVSGDVRVGGNLYVNGTTTTINSATITTTDTIAAPSINAGTIGNAGATLYGTLNSSSASQTNITSVGTLSGLTVSGAIVPSSNASINIGGTGTQYFNNIYAVNFLGTSTTAKYADLAECYTSDAEYAPGTVLDFGGNSEVTLSTTDASTAVAGVVSTNPAYLMNSGLENITQVQLALTGRVPCKVTGTVRQGQMMVSNGDGTARAETHPVLGSVIGKALENFDGDTGVIEVVVGRL